MSTRKKGFSHERDLVKRLWEHGVAVIRSPASGSKTKRVVYPDVVAIYKGRVIVAEVKSVSRPRDIYIEKPKIERLKEFASRAGGEAYVVVKVIGSGEWLFIPLNMLEETGKSYKLPRSVLSSGIKLETIVSILKGIKRLTDYAGDSDAKTST